MTTGNAPTIAEEFWIDRGFGDDEMRDAVKISLEKLAALESQPVPVEPECPPDGWPINPPVKAWRMYAYALQSALQRAQEKYEQAVSNKQIAEAQCAELLQRAEKVEAALKLAQSQLPEEMKNCTILFEQCDKGHGHLRGDNWIKHDCLVCRAEKAEATNRRMVELMNHPSEEMIRTGRNTEERTHSIVGAFKAMSAELLKEVEK